MEPIRLTPGGTCDRCGKAEATAEIEMATFGLVQGQIVRLCRPCVKEIVRRFEKGDGHYG